MKQLFISIAKQKFLLCFLMLTFFMKDSIKAQQVTLAKGFVESLPSLQFANYRQQDHCTSVLFSVTNTGGSASGAFKIHVKNNSTGKIEHSFSVAGLNVFEAAAFSFKKNRARDDWSIIIDPEHQVVEKTRKDNGRSTFCPE